MKFIENVMSVARRAEQALETLLFAATAFLLTGGTIAVCLPGVIGLA
jgi:hypothetical protein